MPKYVITYDLMKPGQVYEWLLPALQNRGAKQLLLSTWGINSSLGSVEIVNWLKPYLDVHDRLIVTELTEQAVSYRTLVDLKHL
jgi:hypothetical protein